MIVEEVFSNEGWETFIMETCRDAEALYGYFVIPADQPRKKKIGFVVYKEIEGKEYVSYPTKSLSEFYSDIDIFNDDFKQEILALIKTGADEVGEKIAFVEERV